MTVSEFLIVYCRELAPGTVSLTGDRAQVDDSKHCAYSKLFAIYIQNDKPVKQMKVYLNIQRLGYA